MFSNPTCPLAYYICGWGIIWHKCLLMISAITRVTSRGGTRTSPECLMDGEVLRSFAREFIPGKIKIERFCVSLGSLQKVGIMQRCYNREEVLKIKASEIAIGWIRWDFSSRCLQRTPTFSYRTHFFKNLNVAGYIDLNFKLLSEVEIIRVSDIRENRFFIIYIHNAVDFFESLITNHSTRHLAAKTMT